MEDFCVTSTLFMSLPVRGKRCFFLMPHPSLSHNHNSWGDRMKGGWCLWGRGPESDQGTSLSGTGHPFKCSHSNEWAGDGWGGLNELRPTWPLGRGSKEEKWCCFINKLLVTNGVLSGEFCTVCVCGGTPASASAPGLIYVTSSS